MLTVTGIVLTVVLYFVPRDTMCQHLRSAWGAICRGFRAAGRVIRHVLEAVWLLCVLPIRLKVALRRLDARLAEGRTSDEAGTTPPQPPATVRQCPTMHIIVAVLTDRSGPGWRTKPCRRTIKHVYTARGGWTPAASSHLIVVLGSSSSKE